MNRLSQIRQAPELYGLHMGMTLDQVKALVPSIQPGKLDDLGFSTTSFSPEFSAVIDKASYAGVRTISLEFLDGKLFTLWIGFNNSFKWKSLDEFVPGMAASLGLPAGAWSVSSLKPSVNCADFEIMASMIAGAPSLRITDLTTKEIWEVRRTEREELKSEQEKSEP